VLVPGKVEKSLIETLCHEVKENYALNIDKNLVLTRCSETDNSKKNSTVRIFAVGASHIVRLVGGLVCHNCEVINLIKPGWTSDPLSVAESESKCAIIQLK
jgi:hypothetical protein